jgi:hypothetical protein
VWRGDFSASEPAIALVGREAGFRIDAAMIQQRIDGIRPDPGNPHLLAPGVFWMHRVGVVESRDLPASEQRLNREDRPWIELLGPMLHAGGNKEKLFTGRRLQSWLDEVRVRSNARSAELPVEAANGGVAGAVFAEFVLCVTEGNRAGAESAQARLKQILPETSYRVLMGQ